MGELKTLENDGSATDFIDAVLEETKRKDSYVLLDLYKRVTGLEPRMWGHEHYRVRKIPLQVGAQHPGGRLAAGRLFPAQAESDAIFRARVRYAVRRAAGQTGQAQDE